MICQRCLLRMQRRSLAVGRAATTTATTTMRTAGSIRTYAANARTNDVAATINSAKARGPARETHEGAPAATSTSAAQPFSAHQGSPGIDGKSPKAEAIPTTPLGSADEIESLPRVKSSVPAGQPLRGLSYLKNKEGPVALEDHEYPPWLWTLLDNKSNGGTDDGSAGDGNMFSKSKAQRKKAMKAAKKNAAGNPEALQPKVPLDHQTIDLPSGDGSLEGAIDADSAREELRSAMRDRRRKAIKESNYLKGMS